MGSKGENQKCWSQILEEAERQGITLEKRPKNSHIKATRAGCKGMVWLASTPSDYRGMRNAISYLRRELGFVWDGH